MLWTAGFHHIEAMDSLASIVLHLSGSQRYATSSPWRLREHMVVCQQSRVKQEDESGSYAIVTLDCETACMVQPNAYLEAAGNLICFVLQLYTALLNVLHKLRKSRLQSLARLPITPSACSALPSKVVQRCLASMILLKCSQTCIGYDTHSVQLTSFLLILAASLH